MNNSELDKKLKQLNTEDVIWIIYIGIILLSWYANSKERDYYITKNEKSKDNYRLIMIIIFIVLLYVYNYFLKDSLNDLMSLKPTDSDEKKKLVLLSFFGSLFIVLSGAIFLYIAIRDEDLNVELAFN